MEATSSDSIRSALRTWRRRSAALTAQRDPLVVSALAAGLTKEEIHQLSGLGRSTIDRIAAKEDDGK
jgi:Arc/MetJ-type ribon-helix-helix transcriptional regulator